MCACFVGEWGAGRCIIACLQVLTYFLHCFPTGLTLVPEWDSSGTGIGLVLIGGVEDGGVADAQGVNEGDEVMLVNDVSVVELGWEGIGSALEGK